MREKLLQAQREREARAITKEFFEEFLDFITDNSIIIIIALIACIAIYLILWNLRINRRRQNEIIENQKQIIELLKQNNSKE